MFEIEVPGSKDSLSEELGRQNREIAEYMEALPLDVLLAPQGDAWSPEGHLRHLAKSVRAVAGGLRVPRLLLLLRFGWGGSSRSFEEIVEIYRQALAEGGQAGRFSPSSERRGKGPEEWRSFVLERWRQAGESLVTGLQSWSESALDRYRMPHPLIGKLTVREMLLFTLYHNQHHARRVVERRELEGLGHADS